MFFTTFLRCTEGPRLGGLFYTSPRHTQALLAVIIVVHPVATHPSKQSRLTMEKMKRRRHLASFEWLGVISYINPDSLHNMCTFWTLLTFFDTVSHCLPYNAHQHHHHYYDDRLASYRSHSQLLLHRIVHVSLLSDQMVRRHH